MDMCLAAPKEIPTVRSKEERRETKLAVHTVVPTVAQKDLSKADETGTLLAKLTVYKRDDPTVVRWDNDWENCWEVKRE
jgi:hypothetical protein